MMSDRNDSTLDTRHGFNEAGGSLRQADLYLQAEKVIDATRLIELGARAGLAQQLTGLEKAKVNRLYCQLKGRPSPSGQTPFSDAWYLKDKRRLFQAAVVWGLYQRLAGSGRSSACVFIDVYECYRVMVSEPLFDLTRVFLVLQLVRMGR